MTFDNNLLELLKKFQAIKQKLVDANNLDSKSFASLSKEYYDLLPIVTIIEKYNFLKDDILELEKLITDSDDHEMQDLAKSDLYEKQKEILTLKHDVRLALLPKDVDDDRNVILEIRAGTGGDEAALFTADLCRMYVRYAERRKWKVEQISSSPTGIGGYKEIVMNISGQRVFSRLKFESGVHRVQRVPETESSGRLHTSASTVAVLPEVEEIDLKIDDKDLRIDVYRSSGPGGQSVNTTDSAVRITHIPTGMVVIQQDEKSQHKNKAKALKVLRARLYEIERLKKETQRSEMRKIQIGSGDRSERIRTYNFPQSRITDHRINMTSYRLNDLLREGDLDEFIESLISEDEARRLNQEI